MQDFSRYGTRIDLSGGGERLDDAPDFSSGGELLDFSSAGTAVNDAAVDTGQGRLSSAWGSLVQGAGNTAGLFPKGMALSGLPDGAVIRNLQRIEAGEPPIPSHPIGVPGGPGLATGDQYDALYKHFATLSPEKRREAIAGIEQSIRGRQDTAMYRSGDAIADFAKDVAPKNPAYEGEFWTDQVPGALGSAGTFLAAAAATRLPAMPFGPGAAAAASYAAPAMLGSTVNRAQQFEEALQHGADVATALDAAGLGAVVGTTEAVPIGNLLNRLDKVSGGQVKRWLARALQQGTEEAVQEAFAGIMNAAISQNLYDPDRGIFTMDRAEEAGVGFTTGVILETLMTLALPGRRRGGGAPPPDTGMPEGAVNADEVLGPAGAAQDNRPRHTASEVLNFAQRRLAELDEKANGTEAREVITPENTIAKVPGKPAERLTDAEKAEQDFLRQNGQSPEAVAQAYGVRVQPDPQPGAEAQATQQPEADGRWNTPYGPATVTQEDIESPLPTGLIAAGKAILEQATTGGLIRSNAGAAGAPADQATSPIPTSPAAAPAPAEGSTGNTGVQPPPGITFETFGDSASIARATDMQETLYPKVSNIEVGPETVRFTYEGQTYESPVTANMPKGDDAMARWAIRSLIGRQFRRAKPAPTPPAGTASATMQPRDRARTASIAQMQDIASNPDPDRLMTAPTPDTGAPMASGKLRVPAGDLGRESTVTLADGKKIPVRYAVVEAADIAASHDADGKANQGYADAPLRALNNGRTAGLQESHRRGTAAGYVEGLIGATQDHGVSADAIRAKRAPVLVRLYDEAENQAGIGRMSNVSAALGQSATEQAMADAEVMPDELMDLYSGGEVDTAGNRDFVRAFVARVIPENQRAEMFDKAGVISQEGVSRIRAAMLAKAYGDAEVVAALIESTDENIRAIGGALMDVSGAWAQLRKGVADGQVDPSMDATAELLEAVKLVQRARREGRSLSEFVTQNDMLSGRAVSEDGEAFLRLMFHNTQAWNRPVGRNKLAEALLAFVAQAEREQAGGDIFGGATPSVRAILDGIRSRGNEGQETDLAAQAPGVPGERAGVDGRGREQADSGAAPPRGEEDARARGQGARTEGVTPPRSNAPEHQNVGASDADLDQIVDEFNSRQRSMLEDDFQVHHLFDPPGKGEIVRLADKVKVYTQENGWMTPEQAKAEIQAWKENARSQGESQDNARKVVLSFFDYTGEWSKPWEEAGYQVYRFDIQHDPEMGDVNNFSTEFFNDWFGSFDGNDIYAILAACPCTDFASSGARHFAAKDKDGRTVASVELVHQTMRAIEYFKPAVWALENPVGRIERLGGLPPWRLSFDPNHIGEDYTKKTLLWGRFNADLPIAPTEPTAGSKMHARYGGSSLATKNARSATPEGFAYAFFHANNAMDNPAMAISWKYDRLDADLIARAVEAGVTEAQIDEAVEDFYYQELDDDAANEAIHELVGTARDLEHDEISPWDSQKPQPDDVRRDPYKRPAEAAPAAEPELTIEDYTEKSIIIRGNTKENIDRIKASVPGRGRPLWNRKAQGWVIAKKHEDAVRQSLADLLEARPTPAAPQRPAGPRVIVNRVGRDGLTDAERGGPLAPQTDYEDMAAGRVPVTDDRERQRQENIRKMQQAEAQPDAAAQLASMDDAALDAMFDEVEGEGAAPAKPDKARIVPTRAPGGGVEIRIDPVKPATDRTASEIAASLGTNLSSASSNAIKGLAELFGTNGKTNAGLTFDPETYAKAKPHFEALLKDVQAAGKDVRDFVKLVVEHFGVGVRPYIKHFAGELRAAQAGPLRPASPKQFVTDAFKEAQRTANDQQTGVVDVDLADATTLRITAEYRGTAADPKPRWQFFARHQDGVVSRLEAERLVDTIGLGAMPDWAGERAQESELTNEEKAAKLNEYADAGAAGESTDMNLDEAWRLIKDLGWAFRDSSMPKGHKNMAQYIRVAQASGPYDRVIDPPESGIITAAMIESDATANAAIAWVMSREGISSYAISSIIEQRKEPITRGTMLTLANRAPFIAAMDANPTLGGGAALENRPLAHPFVWAEFEYGVVVDSLGQALEQGMGKDTFGALLSIQPVPADVDLYNEENRGFWGMKPDHPSVAKYQTRNEYRLQLPTDMRFLVSAALQDTQARFLRSLESGKDKAAEKLAAIEGLGLTPAEFWRNVRNGNIEHVQQIAQASRERDRWIKQGRWMYEPDVGQNDMFAAAKPTPARAAPVAATETHRLAEHFAGELAGGKAFRNITEARTVAARFLGRPVEPGTPAAKTVDEAMELAAVMQARRIIEEGAAPDATYRRLVDLYQQQPVLGTRTSTSVAQQAYSTPLPLAYLAARAAGITNSTTVYEPSAGNGALVLTADPAKVAANELNPDRAENLRFALPGATITENDAADWAPAGAFDTIIANPPFGIVKNEDGETRIFQVNQEYETGEIDHAISLRALESMADDGTAVLIVGSVAKTANSAEARSKAYHGKAKREFYLTLYRDYNVVDHYTVAGELYARQGAGWPVDVIVIRGRGKSSLPLPAVEPPRIYESWDALAEVLNVEEVERSPRPAAATGDRGERRPDAGDGRTGADGRGTRADRQQDAAATDEPTGIRGRPVERESADARPGESAARVPARPAESARPEQRPRRDSVEGENARQVAYQPGSSLESMGTLVPVNMQTAVQRALDGLRERVGELDAFVAERLGYDPATLGDYFAAEQVDALALGLDNMERGAGFIIGDQTGIGKGRVVAGIIRYALKSGRTPIFVTEKPNLYADMYRDLNDIGVPQMLGRQPKMLMTNAAARVALDEDGKNILRTPAAGVHNANLTRMAGEAGIGDNDVVFTTYSQMQTLKGALTPRMEFLNAIAPGSIVIFDESHNAGGSTQQGNDRRGKQEDMNRAIFARQLARAAHGVFYSSATYAKRPEVMDLYGTTDMRLAVANLDQLAAAIQSGGVPMQQAVASMLADAGQYVRRERSFDGVNYNAPVVDVPRQTYADYSKSLNAIQMFSELYVPPAVKAIDKRLKAEGKSVSVDGSTGGAGASSTNFTSVMHNLIDQMLLSIKSDAAADAAIAALERGEKPVITVANTMGSFLHDYAEQMGLKPGDRIELNFNELLDRYLERTRWISVRKPFMKKGDKGERVRLTDADLGPGGVEMFNTVRDAIAAIDFSAMPVSPIDHIRARLGRAGYKVGEITGRDLMIDYRGDGAYLVRRPAKDSSTAGRQRVISGFNSGRMDAVIINQAGATGLSLHASEKFKDQKKRRMVIAQAEKNIDTHMQMLGRVHRTGQVVLPEYDQLVANVPAEKRPAAVLAKKMASLNANTTASRGGALTADNVPDFMNQYGDEVAARVMADMPEIHRAIGSPLSDATDGLEPTDAMRKVTGRIPLLPIDQQEMIYDILESEYNALLAQKEAAGESVLEAKTLDLDARIESRDQVVAPQAGTSPFADGVYLETASVKRLGKPYSTAQVLEQIGEAVGQTGDYAAMRRAGKEATNELWRAVGPEYQAYRTATLDDMATDETRKAMGVRLDGLVQRLRANLLAAPIGEPVRLMTTAGNLYGVVTKIERTGKAKNPVALGSWKVTVALADASRHITIPMSQLFTRDNAPSVQGGGHVVVETAETVTDEKIPLIEAFDRMQIESREKRTIVTGNTLAAFAHVNGKGSIVNFTDSDGGVRQGILMPRDYNYTKEKAGDPVGFRNTAQVVAFVQRGDSGDIARSQDDAIEVTAHAGGIRIEVASSKKQGGKYFLNRKVLDALGRDFVRVGARMRADVDMETGRAAIEQLRLAGAAFEARINKDHARKVVGEVSGVADDGALYSVREREAGQVQDRRSGASGPIRAQGMFDLQPPADVPTARQQAADTFALEYRRVPAQTFKVGLDRVTNHEEAAHVLAPIRKHAQEVFYALVLDKEGRILDVQYHTRGEKDAASVPANVVVPSIAAVEGAAQVWFGHNHPSGVAMPSQADYTITGRLKEWLNGTGVKVAGHVVFGRGSDAFGFDAIVHGAAFNEAVKIKPRLRKRTVTVTERKIRRNPVGKQPVVSTPDEVRRLLIKVKAPNAVLLFNNRNALVGTIAMSPDEMRALKDNEGAGARRVLRAIDTTNANAAVIKLSVPFGPSHYNMATMLRRSANIRVLDAFAPAPAGGMVQLRGWQSAAETRDMQATEGRPSGEWYSMARNNPQTETAEFKRWFGGSKVVDEAGKPLVVYHGTTADFSEFKKKGVRPNFTSPQKHLGFFFASDPSYTDRYTSFFADGRSFQDGARTVPVYLALKNPKVEPIEKIGEIEDRMRQGEAREYRAELEAQGHDGIIFEGRTPIGFVREFVAFRPEQIKSATGNTGAFGPSNPDIRYALRDGETPAASWYFSALTRAVEGIQQPKAQGDQWLAMLRKQPGVKPEEIEWTGLPEFLAGRKSVTKEEVLTFLNENGVRVEEVTLGDPNDPDTPRARMQAIEQELESKFGLTIDMGYDNEAVLEVTEGLPHSTDEENGYAWDFTDQDDLTRYLALSNPGLRGDALIAQSNAVMHMVGQYENDAAADGETARDGTKYGTYVLPGGQGYRELLLTLPEREFGGEARIVELSRQINEARDAGDTARVLSLIEERVPLIAERRERDQGRPARTYQSSHWSQPNVLAHVRFNERTDADGKRVLFIEEVQSDWHQQGRKDGYRGRGEGRAAPARAELSNDKTYWEVTDANGEFVTNVFPSGQYTAEEAVAEAVRRLSQEPERAARDSAVPDAPFKTSWHELALKRMIRYAAENGYDRIAWTDGDTQALRYDLSKQVREIIVRRVAATPPAAFPIATPKPGYRVITVTERDGGRFSFDVTDDGRVSDADNRVRDQIEGKPLADVIGKEMAEKVMGVERLKTFQGLDLRVGGQGMKGFYDNILPKAANKMLKKYGARVGATEVAIEPADRLAAADEIAARVYGRDTEGYAKALAETREKAWGFDLTPALAQAALGGLPLFSRGPVTQKFAASADSLQAAIEAELKKVGIADRVIGRAVQEIRSVATGKAVPGAQGKYFARMIHVAVDAPDGAWVLDHEVVHALRDLGVFREAEWKALERAARKDEARLAELKERYASRNLTEDELLEEAIADLRADWRAGRLQPKGFLKAALEKIGNFLEALGNALRGLGFQSAADIFERIDRGEVGGRGATPGARGARYAIDPDDPGTRDLFGEDIRQQQSLADFERARDERRNPDRDVAPDEGPGWQLFGDSSKQMDIEDVTGKPKREQFALRAEDFQRMGGGSRQANIKAVTDPMAPDGAKERGNILIGALNLQPIDTAFRLPFNLFGGINAQGEWNWGKNLSDAAANTIVRAKFDETGRFTWVNGILEKARAGLLDRYGLDAGYVERERQRGLDERRIMAQVPEIMTALNDAGIGTAEAKVLQAVLTGEAVADADMANLSEPIRNAIDDMGAEAVQLGLISAESFERNRGSYLHRVYLKHETDQGGLSRWVARVAQSRRRKIIGEQFKGRGMWIEADPAKLAANIPGYAEAERGAPTEGEQFRVLDLVPNDAQVGMEGVEPGARRGRDRVFLPADAPIPAAYSQYTDRGVWEVRGMKGKSPVLWRDFTKAERTQMGEVVDARYNIAKTYMMMAHDLATGRFFKDIAGNQDWATETEPRAGTWKDAQEYNRFWMDPTVEWVKVPDTTIPKSNTKRYGALAGRYVRAEIWRDLEELQRMQRRNLWDEVLTQWKLNKALALDTPIPTPNGWTTMGELKAGDLVFDDQGKPCEVLEVKEIQHGRPCFEVVFSDGERIVADDEHWWFTKHRNKGGAVRTTKEIRETLTINHRGDAAHSVPVAGALELEEADLPAPPYAVGLWLGDGHSGSPRITANKEAADELRALLLEAGVHCGVVRQDPRSNAVTFTIDMQPVATGSAPNLFKSALREVGALGDKHIPQRYLRASIPQRFALLRGLMDSDGWITAKGSCGFATSSIVLRDGMLELLRSLAYKPTVRGFSSASGRMAWRIHFQPFNDEPVFGLSAKAARLRPRPATLTRSKTRQIVAINPVESVPVRCISVASKSRLYLAGDAMVPTHNTARSPVVHMNNIMSNLVLMDLADVRTGDLVAGIAAMVKEDEHYRDAVEHGAFGSDMVAVEIRRNILQPLLEDLQREVQGGKDSFESKAGLLGKVADAIWNGARGLDRKMTNLYQLEDELFRMATYMRKRSLGLDPREAALQARDQFLNYDIRAPWINTLRRSVLPFISYTYRAVPVVAHSVMLRPWKIAKYATLAYAANALAYMVAGGDEEDERASLREQEQGRTWIGAPRMMRMPFADPHGNPVFLDVRRWVPAGDVFDMNQGHGAVPIPAPLQFGGPLMLGAELMLNKQAFTGREIVNTNTADWWDTTAAVADWGWKSWMPSAAWIPGSWYWERIGNAVTGARDFQGRPYSVPTAVASSVGVKLKPQDVDEAFMWRAREFDRIEGDLKAELRRMHRDYERGLLSQKALERRQARVYEKLERLDQNRAETFRGRP